MGCGVTNGGLIMEVIALQVGGANAKMRLRRCADGGAAQCPESWCGPGLAQVMGTCWRLNAFAGPALRCQQPSSCLLPGCYLPTA